MTRLIDADALKETINKKKVVGRFNTIQLIDNAPTVELAKVTEAHEDIGYDRGFRDGYAKAVEERPTGEWVEEPIDELLLIYSCSYCGFSSGITWDFCPNCGAKMKGGE